MKIVQVLELPESANPHGVSMRAVHESEHVQVNLITLKPGEALKLHTTPVDAFFYVLEGQGIVEIAGEQQHVSKDMLIDSPARHPHRLLNDSSATFRFLVVKTPKQREATKVG
jgi:mannose-6-phosphate isomerase-like protein (cupin superfamily)